MNKSLRNLIGSLILLIAAVVGYSIWYAKVEAQSIRIGDLVTEIQQQTQATQRIAAAKSALASLSTDQATLSHYFVSTNDIVQFLGGVESTGKFLGANVQVVSVSATPGTPYGQISLSLTITGSFNAVAKTLGAIEYGPNDITLTSLTLDNSTAPQASQATQGATAGGWTASAIFTVGTQSGPAAPPVSVASTTTP